MKKLIIKRTNEYSEYILEAEGYIPEELEEDLEELVEDFAYDEDLRIEEAFEKMNGFKKFHKKRNGIIIKFYLNYDYNTYANHSVRSLTIGIHAKRSFFQTCKEFF